MNAVAIDGPAASGKTAIGSEVAQRLGYRFLDTGAMYRALTWAVLESDVSLEDEHALAQFAQRAAVELGTNDGRDRQTTVIVNGADATPHLRDDAVERSVSLVSRVPGVREALVRIQREVARDGGIVMAGRDIGSVVLPDANVKVYLDASLAVRAQRRAQQLERMGGETNIAELVAELKRRDTIDSSRAASPLTAAPGAAIINTDELTIEEVVRRIVALAHG